MAPNPPLGVALHALGGLASAIFYLPFRKVKFWAWESYWLAGGVFSWIVAPWTAAALATPDLLAVLRQAPAKSLFWSYFFGALWGIGGLSFGLTVRYLGFGLGAALALGYCAAFGTLLPPIFSGEIAAVLQSGSGRIVLAGVAVCILGIVISGLAGVSKERELPEPEKKSAIQEFSFVRGVWVATFCGVMSACMAYGFAAGKPIAALAVRHGAPDVWKNLPVLIVILAGGFTTNFVWCLALNLRHQSFADYFRIRLEIRRAAAEPRGLDESAPANVPARLLANYAFSALAGTLWYLQFFFYGMGTSKMGRFDFSSWTLHMASIIIFGAVVGVSLSEWKGASRRTRGLMKLGVAVLVASTVIIGYGNYLAKPSAAAADPPAPQKGQS